MKVEGQKYLFGNFFEKMTIEEKKDGIVCRVQPSISGQLLTGKNIFGNFKEDFNNSRDDYEKVLKLVKYFLRYNQVTMLCENSCDHRVKHRSSIEIGGNRKLLLSINQNPYQQEILTLIKNKCLYDLENILFNTLDEKNVVLISFYKTGYLSEIKVWGSCYFDENFECVSVPEEKCISINYPKFMKENIKQITIKLINRLLEQSKEYCSYYISGYMHIKLGNLHLVLHEKELQKEIADMIYEHNCSLIENNQKELKLEYGKRR